MFYDLNSDTKSWYIHWPFCPYRCYFCPFLAFAAHEQFMMQYHDALCSEIAQFLTAYCGSREVESIFLGGGTPSTYPDNLLLDTFDTLRHILVIGDTSEISIEVNPGTAEKRQFALWKTVGINRVSLGVQSLKNDVLRSLNRNQRLSDVYTVLADASVYFNNISIDLMLGLPGITSDEWKQQIREVVNWPITHISIYFLTVHENTKLYFMVAAGQCALPSDSTIIELYYWTIDWLAYHGFEQYELSNFAKVGYTSKHNSAYWDRKPYKGFGIGACSFDGKSRFQNEKNLTAYLESSMCKSMKSSFSETLTAEQVHLEKVMLGLRRPQGIERELLFEGMSISRRNYITAVVEELKKRKLLRELQGQLCLTKAGLVLENEIITRLSS